MITVERVAELRTICDTARRDGARVGFVPTMGYFHEGHRSLMRAARAANDLVVVSLFVNPTQFGPNEDLGRYPRDPEGDATAAEREGVDVLFVPSVAEMYPEGSCTTVHVEGLTAGLCGASRPDHFDGVTTVVAKLFAMVGPCRAYFGRKDAQQLAVIRRMTTDLALPVEVVGCPLVREPDGLAMSSRNAFLAGDDRQSATVLAWALRAAGEAAVAGERDAGVLRRVVVDILAASPAVRLDYAEVVDAHTLEPSATIGAHTLVAVAAFVGSTRLIDNIAITVTPDAHGREVVTVDTGVITPAFTDPTFAHPPLAAAAAEVAIP
ncbi:MAG: pantoate--beta-alanine ligase [Acidimicrobiia bacterium]